MGGSRWICRSGLLCVKRQEDFLLAPLNNRYFDVVYFDAFSPENANLSCGERSCYRRYMWRWHLVGCLTTYCAKGVVRRMLQKVGFVVENVCLAPP